MSVIVLGAAVAVMFTAAAHGLWGAFWAALVVGVVTTVWIDRAGNNGH